MKNEKVYHWSDLAWDLGLANGMQPESIFEKLDSIKDTESQDWWLEANNIQDAAKTSLAEKLWRDIYNGKLAVRKANGDPIDGKLEFFQFGGEKAPHFTLEEGNQWLKENHYLQTWEPNAQRNVAAQPETEAPNVVTSTTENNVLTMELTAAKSEKDQWVCKKSALIKNHSARWPTIMRDFQDAGENGLRTAAKATKHGDWFESKALNWARQKGKLISDEQQGNPLKNSLWNGLLHKI